MIRSTVLVRVASALVMLALLIELATLFWSHPLSFIVFATIGGAALVAGLLLFLYWLIVADRRDATAPPRLTKE
jgi:hypothetical protein